MAAPGVASASPGEARGRRSTLEITTVHDHDTGEHHFELSTQQVPSGWTTIALDNPTDHTHFAYLARVPQQAVDDAAAADVPLLDFYVETVTGPFQYYMDTLVPGKTPDPDDLSDRYESFFPPWFGELQPSGGPGLTSAWTSSTTTVALEPGEYIVECYVKDANNDFHSYRGMIDHFTVTTAEADAPEPESTFDVSLWTPDNGGIVMTNDVRPGRHVVAVHFEEQQIYDNLVGHDAHLIRLDDETDVCDVARWMNWADPDQLISDGDEPGTFLGGVQDIVTTDLPRTGYVHVNLKPGRYAWVAEVPDPDEKGLLKTFCVPSRRG